MPPKTANNAPDAPRDAYAPALTMKPLTKIGGGLAVEELSVPQPEVPKVPHPAAGLLSSLDDLEAQETDDAATAYREILARRKKPAADDAKRLREVLAKLGLTTADVHLDAGSLDRQEKLEAEIASMNPAKMAALVNERDTKIGEAREWYLKTLPDLISQSPDYVIYTAGAALYRTIMDLAVATEMDSAAKGVIYRDRDAVVHAADMAVSAVRRAEEASVAAERKLKELREQNARLYPPAK